MKRLTLLAALPFVLVACASNPPLPQPEGKPVQINSLSTAAMLAHQKGFVVIGKQRHEPEVQARLLFRPSNPDDYATVQGGELVERTITVPFEYGSTKFSPTPAQAFYLHQLMAAADRVEVRGRTDANSNTAVNQKMAKRRAEAARHYLIDRGMHNSLISMNFMASGDPIASNHNTTGRGANRRVELEFFIDDFDTPKATECRDNQPTYTGCKSMGWQEVGAAPKAKPRNTSTQKVSVNQWQDIK